MSLEAVGALLQPSYRARLETALAEERRERERGHG
jgi:hypothetical protein